MESFSFNNIDNKNSRASRLREFLFRLGRLGFQQIMHADLRSLLVRSATRRVGLPEIIDDVIFPGQQI